MSYRTPSLHRSHLYGFTQLNGTPKILAHSRLIVKRRDTGWLPWIIQIYLHHRHRMTQRLSHVDLSLHRTFLTSDHHLPPLVRDPACRIDMLIHLQYTSISCWHGALWRSVSDSRLCCHNRDRSMGSRLRTVPLVVSNHLVASEA